MSDEFYRAFEERFRGSRDLIKTRLEVYMPFLAPLSTEYPEKGVIDLGCGRGEWLELLQLRGLNAKGVDLDKGMLAACSEHGLDVRQTDAVEFLKSLENESQIVVSAFHFVEHISFEALQAVVAEAHRVLVPGGILIMETPNPDNISVATRNFYLDPSHVKPIPAPLLEYMAEFAGFFRVKSMGLQEPSGIVESETISLSDVLNSVSPDYAVIAQKVASADLLERFDGIFALGVGVSQDELVYRFDKRIADSFRNVKRSIEYERERNLRAEEKSEAIEKKVQLLSEKYEKVQVNIQELVEGEKGIIQGMSQADGRIACVEEQLEGIWDKVDHLEKDTQLARDNSQTAQSELGRITTELHDVYASKSWRLTAPLREIRVVARAIKRWCRSKVNVEASKEKKTQANGVLRRLSASLINSAIAYIKARPRLKRVVRGISRRVPGLAFSLHRFHTEVTVFSGLSRRGGGGEEYGSGNYASELSTSDDSRTYTLLGPKIETLKADQCTPLETYTRRHVIRK